MVARAARPRDGGRRRRPGRPRRARLLVRALRPVLGVLRGRAGGRSARDPARRHGLRAAAGDDARVRRDRAAVHAELRAAPRPGGGGARPPRTRSPASSGSSARASRARRCRPCASGSRPRGARAASTMRARRRSARSPTRARTHGGLHLFEDEYVCEVLDPATGEPVPAGATGELVTTALSRTGFPVIRYRTGDMIERTQRAVPGGPSRHVAAAGDPRPGRRHGRDPRDERVPVGDRGDPAPLGRRRRVLDHVLQRPARDGRGQGRGRARARARRARHPGAAAPDARAARPDRAGQAGDPADLQRQGAARAGPAPGGPALAVGR